MFTLKHPVIDIGIVCSDFDRAYEFFHKQLGLELALDIQIPASTAQGACLAPDGFRQMRFRAGDTLIKIMEIAKPPAPRNYDFEAGVRWLTFIVEDVPAIVEKLKQRGVEFMSEPVSAPDAKHVVCAKGPDGILIEFVQLPD